MNDTSRTQLLAAFLVGLATLFVAESVYVTATRPEVDAWMIPIHLGVGAPVALAVAWPASRAAALWGRQFTGDWPDRRVSAWLVTTSLSLTFLVGGVAWTALSSFGQMATPAFAATATGLAAALLAALLLFLAAPVARGVAAVLQHLEEIDNLRWISRPSTWLIAGLGAGGTAVGAGFGYDGDTMRLMPWAYLVGPVVGAAAGYTTWRLLRSRGHLAARLNRYTAIGLVALGLFALLLPASLEDARNSFVDRDNLAAQFKSLLHPVLDFDGDGHLFFYAGGDCAPFDPERGPHAREVPNDGIDWNCSGSDLTVDPDQFDTGPARVERPDGIDDNPHVILVTTDALSHPHTSVADYHRDVTPHLADWARRATVFENAFANSTSTRLAMPGLLASKMNSQIHLEESRRHPYPYADDEETLGTVLDDAGYRTVHIPGTAYFDDWGGYWNGYDEIDTDTYADADHEHHTSPELTEAAVDVVQNHDDDQPLHLWVHYFDHHGPYVEPDDGKIFGDGDDKVDRFDSELRYADRHWRHLLEAVEQHWDPEEYILIFTSDHGEAFDDNHVDHHHDFSVYTRPLHVPLIIQAPWGRGERIDGLAGHVDVLPTIANLVDAEPSDGWDERLGETLVPSLTEGAEPQKSAIYSLFYIPEAIRTDEDRFQMYGVRTDEWYFYEDWRSDERRLVRWREDELDRHSYEDEKPDKFEEYRYIGQRKLSWLEDREIGLTHLEEDDE